MRAVREQDRERLQQIRAAAFAPIFDGFRASVEPFVAERAFRRADAEQAEYLDTLLAPDSGWGIFTAEAGGEIVGFIGLRRDDMTRVGEVGLNAISPEFAGKGLGTEMFEFALNWLADQGMEVATVSTGGDEAHAPARRAYEKVGFTPSIPAITMYRRLGPH